MPSTSKGGYKSHEAVCVLNTSEKDANIEIIVYFEDREPMDHFCTTCRARRANHIRLDMIEDDKGRKIPCDTPYALLIKSDVPVVVQHSRMDVSQAEMTLMTSIAY